MKMFEWPSPYLGFLVVLAIGIIAYGLFVLFLKLIRGPIKRHLSEIKGFGEGNVEDKKD